ncbi:16S rRNA (adenine(1518)-N(6)/adenine(1519)-N(6))-dimethyltransferase RsmA [Oscillospiraceae bacterium MB08-C2-2]|nr:16S rRNA (adenine(1518)-N(6)/adenine(1519)-N(6))-dimethyltransferase RsmA [Oscillospiraceae bacterium MB08-C2-2]
MENLTNIKTIRELLDRHGFRFSKALGQNFIINPGICPHMAEASGADEGVGVLEIGPGLGVLTTQLARLATKVVSIELDARLLPVLEETLADCPNTKVIHGDALKVDLHKLIAEEFAGLRVVVCANLPYYVTSPILMRLLEERLPVDTITVMVQKEAATRICAPLPSREAGAVTVAVHYYAKPEILFGVSKGSFMPAPNVDSSVIRLEVRPEPPVQGIDEALFFSVVKGAFSQRRKTLLNCMAAHFRLEKSAITSAMEQAGIAPSTRAEQLSIEDFARLTTAMSALVA